jgi:tetratricopeptide (TPR) repeat protein
MINKRKIHNCRIESRRKKINVKKEFLSITSILPLRLKNDLSDEIIRKDAVFDLLAEKIFDHPQMLRLLLKKIKLWLKYEKSEFIFSLSGYVYYINKDFRMAEKYFLKSVNLNPGNLDNWFDLAFSLYHQSDYRNCLAKKILFNFDYCAKLSNKRIISLSRIKRLAEKI